MTALVLLHSPLTGPRSWARAASLLANAIVSDYAAVLDGSPPFYLRIVRAVASQIPDDDLVLVAHSGAGALIPLLAQHIGSSVRGAIFADAILPHPRKSWMDTAPAPLVSRLRAIQKDGYLPPWNRWWPKETLEAMLPDAAMPASLPCAYLQLSESYGGEVQTARDLSWRTEKLALNHLAILSDSDAVAAALKDVMGKVLVRAR